MKTIPVALAALSLSAAAVAQTPQQLSAQADEALRTDSLAWDFVEGLTTEVGPRLAGTAAEARARQWAADWLKRHGFANVHVEPFTMPGWVRGTETATVIAPFPQPLAISALGDSAATPADGITAEVVPFMSYAELESAPAGSLSGKIAYIGHAMRPTQDGSGYGFAGPARWTGPSLAASKGALATVIKSVGTDHHRNPHTGGTTFAAGVSPIPAGALSVPDAENLERMFVRANGRPVRLHLILTPQATGDVESGNVIAEISGRDPSLPPVLLACHIDSWDLGTGAIDDGAGCGIIAAAAKRVQMAGQPLRTIRLLLAGAEEVGVYGGKAYAQAHGDKPVAVALESDFGADRIWRLDTNFADSNEALNRRLAQGVARFGVLAGTDEATGGADIGIAREQKTALIDLNQDGTRYFDLHHTPDDTLDKIDPGQLRQNVAVWTQVVGILANEPGTIRPKS